MNKLFRPKPTQSDMWHGYELDLWRRYADNTDLLSTTGGESKFTDLEDEMMIWIEQNCIGKILYDEDMLFFFKYENDRIAFKLVWG